MIFLFSCLNIYVCINSVVQLTAKMFLFLYLDLRLKCIYNLLQCDKLLSVNAAEQTAVNLKILARNITLTHEHKNCGFDSRCYTQVVWLWLFYSYLSSDYALGVSLTDAIWLSVKYFLLDRLISIHGQWTVLSESGSCRYTEMLTKQNSCKSYNTPRV